jgi:hypothetical protein
MTERASGRLRVRGILYAVGAPLFVWSGQLALVMLQQALAGLLLAVVAVIICCSTAERSVMTGEMATRWTCWDVGGLGPV